MKIIFFLLCLAMLGYETIALFQRGGATISEIIWGLSSRPLIPFAFGMLMGHFFWQMQPK